MALEDAKKDVDGAVTRTELRGHSAENTFGGALSFLRRKYTKDLNGVDLAVTGVPFDQAVTNRPGTRLGPRAIREASALQVYDPPYGWDVDPMVDIAMADYGDLAFDYAKPADFGGVLQAHIAGILAQGSAVLSLGGDHSISHPILRAHAEVHGPVSLLQFDAHCDTWPDDDLTRTDHGTMFGKAAAEGVIVAERSVQIGLRTVNDTPGDFHILDAPFVHKRGIAASIARTRDVLGDHPVYVTFDIDCLDPAFAPGTGTPVWGGLSSAQAAALLRGLAGLNVVGMDVVEVSPPFDPAGITAIAGANVAMELACLWAAGPKGQAARSRHEKG